MDRHADGAECVPNASAQRTRQMLPRAATAKHIDYKIPDEDDSPDDAEVPF